MDLLRRRTNIFYFVIIEVIRSKGVTQCLNSRFISRLEGGNNDAGRLIVTVAEAIENEKKPIIFDIDSIAEKEIPSEWKILEELIEGLHASTWSVFEGAIGPKLREVLDGK